MSCAWLDRSGRSHRELQSGSDRRARLAAPEGSNDVIRRHATELRALLALFDACAAVAVLAVASLFRFGASDTLEAFAAAIPNPEAALAIYAAAWPVALWTQGMYRPRARLTFRGEIVDILRATAVFARLAVRGLLVHLRQSGRNTRFVLVLGAGSRAQAFADLVESQQELGLSVIGHLSSAGDQVAVGRPILGSVEEIEEVLHSNVVDEVAVCLPMTEAAHIDVITKLCEEE